MKTKNNDLIPTSSRLDRESLRQLSEAAAIQRTTRTELLRQAVTEILDRWKQDRRAIIQALMDV